MNCKNCGNKINGNYCNICGQSASVDRINWNYLKRSVNESILQVDKGFFYTLKQLITKPGSTLKEFLEGKRVKYFKPFTFLLITASFYILVNNFLGNVTYVDDFLTSFLNGANGETPIQEEKMLKFLRKNQTYAFLLTVPIYAFSVFIFFKKSKYIFTELLVVNLYITGLQLIIYTMLPFIFDRNSIFTIVPLLLGFIYNWWVQNQLFDQYKWFKRNLKLTLAYILYLVLFLIICFLIVVIASQI